MQLKHLIAGSLVLGLVVTTAAEARDKKAQPANVSSNNEDSLSNQTTKPIQDLARQTFGAPANDACVDAATITDGPTCFDNSGAADSPGLTFVTGDCPSYGGGGEDAFLDIWWSYTATCTGNLLLTTCDELGGDSEFDTVMAIYETSVMTCPGASIDCNDDDAILACGQDNPGPFQSTINTAVVEGNEYLVRLGGWDDTQFGTGVLVLDCQIETPVCGDTVCNYPDELCCPECAFLVGAEGPAEGLCDTSGNCFDGLDNDCDGNVDCDDTACQIGAETVSVDCFDGVDNDCDGLADCDDDDCTTDILCSPSTASCEDHLDTLQCQVSILEAANNAESGSTSDLSNTLGFLVGDNFHPLGGVDNEITGMCAYGTYHAFDLANSDCAPGDVDDDFRVTIYDDFNGGLLPGGIKHQWGAGDGLTWVKSFTGQTLSYPDAGDPTDTFSEFLYTFTFPETITQGADECLWVEVANNTTGADGNCGWRWSSSEFGDGLSAQAVVEGFDCVDADDCAAAGCPEGTTCDADVCTDCPNPANEAYAPGDSLQKDFSFCMNGSSFINTVDVCGQLTTGACCTPITAVCIDDVPFNECVGQFTADTLCDDLPEACGTINTNCNLDTQTLDDPACQPTDLNTGLVVNAQAFNTAKLMDIAEALEITEVCYWGTYFSFAAGAGCTEDQIQWEDFTITFYNDDAGGALPGTLMSEYNVGVVPRVDIGTENFAGVEYSFSTALPETVNMAPGTFWVQVRNDGSTDEFSCVTADDCTAADCTEGTLCEGGLCTGCFEPNPCTFTWVTEGSSTESTGVYAQTAADEWLAGDEADGSPTICLGAAAPCTTIADCGDSDGDGFRDDVCLHYACEAGVCIETPRGVGQSDMGGSFGACDNDGTCDGNDRFLALGCFGANWPGAPCEDAPPVAVNVDAGGSFGSCVLDGVCDGNDAFAALNCFGGDEACPCGGAPSPEFAPVIDVVDSTSASLVASNTRVKPGSLVTVEVYFDEPISDLRGYQLHVVPTGGDRGQLELVDIAVEARRDAAIPAEWQAFNVDKAQVVVGMDSAGVETRKSAYLATFTYRVSRDAAGTFVVDMLHDNSDPTQRTFVFPTPNHAKIQITGTTPAKISVDPVRRVSR